MRTKKAIYDSAINLFREYGYEKVKVEDIARVTGISKGTFYLHYSSKVEILFEFYVQIDNFYMELEKESEYTGIQSPLEKLAYFSVRQAEYIEKIVTLDIARILYMNQIDKNNPGISVLQKTRPHLRIISGLIEDGQKNGEILSTMSPDQLTCYVMNITRGFVYDWILEDGSYSLTEDAKVYFPLIYKMLSSKC